MEGGPPRSGGAAREKELEFERSTTMSLPPSRGAQNPLAIGLPVKGYFANSFRMDLERKHGT
jgi:hypothetical protein